MNRAASPRHPFKALMAVVAMAALVHGVCAQVDTRHAPIGHVRFSDTLPWEEACADADDDWTAGVGALAVAEDQDDDSGR